MVQRDLKGSFVLLFFAIITAFAYNHFSPFGIAMFGQWETAKGVVTANSKTDSPNGSIEINHPEIIHQIVEHKKRLVIDVRPRETYAQGHLPHAISFPLMAFDENIAQILGTIDRKAPVLVYCSSIECSDSHTFAQRLIRLRYEDVKVFSGGFRQWQEKGYEIEKNEE